LTIKPEPAIFFDDSDIEDLLFVEDVEQMIVLLAMKDLKDRKNKKKKKHRESTAGHLCISWKRALVHDMVMHDYSAELPMYPPNIFRVRYRIRRDLFVKIVLLARLIAAFLPARET
jgi:hypothetical protein